MSQSYIPQSLQRRVTQKHQHRCSYCRTPEAIIGDPLTIDHILPEALGGETSEENLCLACWSCNLRKQKRITAIDPNTGQTTRFFHPNQQVWTEHFSWSEDDVMIVGLTATGRTTISALQMNRPSLLKARRIWRLSGWNPVESK